MRLDLLIKRTRRIYPRYAIYYISIINALIGIGNVDKLVSGVTVRYFFLFCCAVCTGARGIPADKCRSSVDVEKLQRVPTVKRCAFFSIPKWYSLSLYHVMWVLED